MCHQALHTARYIANQGHYTLVSLYVSIDGGIVLEEQEHLWHILIKNLLRIRVAHALCDRAVSIDQSYSQFLQVLEHFFIILEHRNVNTHLRSLFHDFECIVQIVSTEGLGSKECYICKCLKGSQFCPSITILIL